MTDQVNPVEILARGLGKSSETSPYNDAYDRKARAGIRALEAAGFRIVGPEPTGEMSIAGREAIWGNFVQKELTSQRDTGCLVTIYPAGCEIDATSAFVAMHAAAPTYGEPDRG